MTKSERAALREHWRQIVTECENRDASISKRAWCEEHGIVLRLLYYWQRQFREGNDEPQSTPAFLDLTDVWEERHEKPGESSSIPFDPVLMIQTGNCSIYIGAVAKTETAFSSPLHGLSGASGDILTRRFPGYNNRCRGCWDGSGKRLLRPYCRENILQAG